MTQEIAQATLYLSGAIAAWPLGKYLVGPAIKAIFEGDKSSIELIKNSWEIYQQLYNKTIEAREEVVTELGKKGMNGEEISDIVEKTLPFPEHPKL